MIRAAIQSCPVKACDDGKYGLRCLLPCGHCQGGGACDPENGTCPLCDPGYYPPTCQDACRDKTYGKNCSERCGHCKGGQPCNTTTGECTDGCQPGYTGSHCKTQCNAGLYGERCNGTCGHCQVNTTCHHEDGHCLAGCVAEFTGPMCSQAAVSGGSTGVVGGAVGGVIAAIVVIVAITVVIFIIRRRKRREKPDDQSRAGAEMTGSTDPLTSAHSDDPSSPPRATTALSFAPVASMAPAAYANTKPQAEVKPTVKPGVKPKPHPPAKTNEAIYENVTISNQKPKPESSSEPKSANTKASPKLTGTKNEDAVKEKKGKPPVAIKPTKGRASRAGTETPPEPLADDEEEDFGPTDAIYGNEQLYGNIKPTGIRLDKLQDTVVKRMSDGSLVEEFMRMIPNKEFSLKNGQRDENYYKNRFNSILPYDKNRVELEQVDGDDASDYVNASFVKGYKSKKAYIAAQGPKVNTQDDFWRMVWQEGVAHIVMLTNVKEGNKPKCYEYWPAQGDKLTTGHMEVTGVEEETRAHFVIRTFDLKQTEGSEKRRVKQYHYQSWMDHEVPATTPLVNFWRYVRSRALRTAQAPPLVVHCSAGVGRTGTFIALDIIYDQAQQEAEVNMYNTVDRLRDDRCHMVQNKNQYAFLHEAVVEAYMSGDSRIQMSDMDTVLPHAVTHHTPSDRVDREFETLCKMRDSSTTPTYATASLEENRAKNRNPKALP
ncbi:receptor-type tyrosine-protein phosphatase alpha-like, partial [Littorina saxatilis]|uniref:receptor-type tyrosine-protein phosphatase alpha-like n=1 Tax=Littorina saxatilis TaxID=31220 RepID=UPI0038B57059